MFVFKKLQADQILKTQFLIKTGTWGGGALSAIRNCAELLMNVFCSKPYFKTETGNAGICAVKEASVS